MSILELRYYLATEIGLIVSIISLAVALFTVLVTFKKKNPTVQICMCIIVVLLVGLLLVNQSDMKNYIKVPYVESISVEFARHDLINAGFDRSDISVLNDDAAISDSTAKVQKQSIQGGTIVAKGTKITLDCISNLYTGIYEENMVISGVESSTSTDSLSIIIEDYELFTDGFHYEFPIDENSYSFVDFDRGISGHFSYSRELTEQEYKNWGHGGKILDASGNETDIDASFFSTSDGVFAVELPEYMPKGDYVYLLYQFINDAYYEARIDFTVN